MPMEVSYAVDAWMQSIIPPECDKTDERPVVILEDDEQDRVLTNGWTILEGRFLEGLFAGHPCMAMYHPKANF